MTATSEPVTFKEMIEGTGVTPHEFYVALRAQQFPWHGYGQRWTVERDSPEHSDMLRVLERL